jgi:hypothetical protein
VRRNWYFIADAFTRKDVLPKLCTCPKAYERKPTTYQANTSSDYWFSEKGFRSFPAANDELPPDALTKDTWHLVDPNIYLESLLANLEETLGQIIQATSPQPKWYKEWAKQKNAKKLYLEPLEWEELYVIA